LPAMLNVPTCAVAAPLAAVAAGTAGPIMRAA
jgi:hypothetical protein